MSSYVKVRREKKGFTALDKDRSIYIIQAGDTDALCKDPKLLRPSREPNSWNFLRPFVSPILMKWDLTYRCNLNCLHCYSNSSSTGEYGLSTELCKRIINILDETGVLRIQLLGGEPTCRRDYLEIINYAKEKEFDVCLNTNATLISKDEACRLKLTGIDFVQVGLDGIKNTHDHFRGAHGAFRKTLHGIQNLVNAGLNVGVVTVLNKNNVSEIKDIIDLDYRMGVQKVQFLSIACSGRGAAIRDLRITSEERFRCQSSVEEARKMYPQMEIDAPGIGNLAVDELIVKEGTQRHVVRYGCYAGTYSLELDPFGNLHLCSLELHETVGNIIRDNPFDLYEKAFILKKKNPPPECKGCERFLVNCWGHCLLRDK